MSGPKQSFRLSIDGGIQIAHGSMSKIIEAISRSSEHRYYVRDINDTSFVVTLYTEPASIGFTRHGTSVDAAEGHRDAPWVAPMIRTLASINPTMKEIPIP